MSRHARARAVLLACVAAAHACASAPPPQPAAFTRAAEYPGELLDSAALPELFLRQRIEARWAGGELSFAAVLQSAGGVLSLLAFTPYGTRAFLLEQRGRQVRFTRYVDRALPFSPRFVLLDVHRALFLGLPGAPLRDGAHEGVRDGERVVERWRGGALLERTFERLDGRPRGVIRVQYGEGMRGAVPPARIDLDNAWFGYRLAVHTLAVE